MSFMGVVKKYCKAKLLSGPVKNVLQWRTFFSHLPGSLTVETAMVLPVFMFALVSLMSVAEIIRSSDIVSSRLHQNAREMAVSAYVADKTGVFEGSAIPGMIGGIGISQSVVNSDVERVRREEMSREGSISYLSSKYLEKDIIDLVAAQEYTLPYDFMGIGKFRIVDRARVHAFTGFDPVTLPDALEKSDEEMVYITSTGTVYHRNRNCPHLNVSVRKVMAAQVADQRNASGGKFYECEYCASKGDKRVYYITDHGDRYHTVATCQGLKRDVMAIPISKAGDRPPCKSCGN